MNPTLKNVVLFILAIESKQAALMRNPDGEDLEMQRCKSDSIE